MREELDRYLEECGRCRKHIHSSFQQFVAKVFFFIDFDYRIRNEVENNLPKSFPKPDCLNPPNGAATSVLLYVFIKTVPASSFSLIQSALLMSFVKMPEANPYSVLFARRSTPSTSLWEKELIYLLGGKINKYQQAFTFIFIETPFPMHSLLQLALLKTPFIKNYSLCQSVRFKEIHTLASNL